MDSTSAADHAAAEEENGETGSSAFQEEKEEDSRSISNPLNGTPEHESFHQDAESNLHHAVATPPISSVLRESNNTNDHQLTGDLHLSKQRASLAVSDDVGATHVDEPAPNLNLRFFRLSSRRTPLGSSCSLYNESRTSSNHTPRMGISEHRSISDVVMEEPEMTASVRRTNSIHQRYLSGSGYSSGNSRASSPRNGILSRFSRDTNSNRDSNVLISATLVEPMELAEAEPVGFCQKHAKAIGSTSFILLVALVTIISLSVNGIIDLRSTPQPTLAPSSVPSMAPSFDPRPTLAIVQERGTLRCGLHQSREEGSFRYQLCQAIAAVTLNDPSSLDIVDVTAETRFVSLNERTSDILAGGETYTIEREVNEPTTKSSFTFSTPYYYDGMAFAGNQTYVTCAEEQKRYNECTRMIICVTGSTTDHAYVASHFTTDFFIVTEGLESSIHLYKNDTCNVVGSSRFDLLDYKYRKGGELDSAFVIGDETFNNDPLSYVTRPDDIEWSNIVNWVLQSLFYGERQGIGKNESMCQTNTKASLDGTWSELDFLNAVYCVGNYQEIYESSELVNYTRTAINTINNGTPMLYVIPYGNLDNSNDEMLYDISETFSRIKKNNKLKCGLLIRDGYYPDNIIQSDGLFGMGIGYCQALASSMLDGNLYGVNYTVFYDAESSLAGLNNETVDVLLGVTADLVSNFGNSSSNENGVVFSTPYFYGNQTGNTSDVEFFPVMTRQNDIMFSSFVNCIVMSTIYALDNHIDKEDSYLMPLILLFGNDMMWALRDALAATGNYDEIYLMNFGTVDVFRGRNDLNSNKEPQLLDMPR